jgi:hypothetical protein
MKFAEKETYFHLSSFFPLSHAEALSSFLIPHMSRFILAWDLFKSGSKEEGEKKKERERTGCGQRRQIWNPFLVRWARFAAFSLFFGSKETTFPFAQLHAFCNQGRLYKTPGKRENRDGQNRTINNPSDLRLFSVSFPHELFCYYFRGRRFIFILFSTAAHQLLSPSLSLSLSLSIDAHSLLMRVL